MASNVPDGVRSALLGPLCGPPTADTATYNCSDLGSLGAFSMPEWHDLVQTSSGDGSASGVSSGTAALLLDQAISSAANRGFFSTSKFCGPPGFRKSTFSEAIALQWQQLHGAGKQPLCAHAMEKALLQGRAAHGEFVY